MKHQWKKISQGMMYICLFATFALTCAMEKQENVAHPLVHIDGTIVQIDSQLGDLIIELVELAYNQGGTELISDELKKVGNALVSKSPVALEDFSQALPEISSYLQNKAAIGLSRDVSGVGGIGVGGPGTTAPITCALGSLVPFLNELQGDISDCCADIQAELQETSSIIMDVAISLEASTTSFIALLNTFSTFELIAQELQETVSLLNEAVTELASTASTITETLAGTFTVIDACCAALSAEFVNTNTLLLSEFSGTYSALNQGFNDIYDDFNGTWTQLAELLSSTGCSCDSQFQATWTLLNLLQQDCGCDSQFQQTWTILDNLMLTITAGCDCTPQFQQTWALLAEGFNSTFTNFQSTFTAIDGGFQGTFSLLDELNCGFVSIFDEKEQSTRLDLINTKFNYGVSSYDTTTSTFGSGFVNSFTSMALINTGTGSNAFAQVQSKNALRYRAGHENYAIFSAQFSNGGAATSTQWIGIFDSQDGLAVGFSNTSFALLYRNAGVNTIIMQSSFNRDNLNGTGPSGFTLNPIRLNVFRIVFGWLGASPIKFQILDQSGRWITFHEINRANQFFVPTFRSPYLPMTAQVNKSGGASTIQIGTGGWNGGIIGEPSNASSRYFTAESNTIASGSGANIHRLTLRNKTTFQGRANKISLRISFFDGGNLESDNDSSVIRLFRNATVTGLSFTNVDAANSIAEVSTAGTYTPGTGTYLMSILTQADNQVYAFPIQENELNILLEPNESITFTAESLTGASGNVFIVNVSWEELF